MKKWLITCACLVCFISVIVFLRGRDANRAGDSGNKEIAAGVENSLSKRTTGKVPVGSDAAKKTRTQAVTLRFLQHMKAHQYAQAHPFLTSDVQQRIGIPTLQRQWAAFEKARGGVQKWSLVDWLPSTVRTGATRQEYVLVTYRVQGTKGKGMLSLQLVPVGEQWRIATISYQM